MKELLENWQKFLEEGETGLLTEASRPPTQADLNNAKLVRYQIGRKTSKIMYPLRKQEQINKIAIIHRLVRMPQNMQKSINKNETPECSPARTLAFSRS